MFHIFRRVCFNKVFLKNHYVFSFLGWTDNKHRQC